MIEKALSHRLILSLAVMMLLALGCTREPVVEDIAESYNNVSDFQSNVVQLDTLVFVNPVRTNGQVRFDLLGTPPEIKVGDMVFFAGVESLYGKVNSVSVVGSRVFLQLDKSTLDKVFKSIVLLDNQSIGPVISRTRIEEERWSSDSLSLAGWNLFDDYWQSQGLDIQFVSGKMFSKAGVREFGITAQGSDPWFDRIILKTDYSLDIAASVNIRSSGAVDATDSIRIESVTYGPFLVNGFPITYQVDTWIGFHIVTLGDTTLSMAFTSKLEGNLALKYNYWDNWQLTRGNVSQVADVPYFQGPKFSDYLAEIFVSQIVSPKFCGESSISVANRFSSDVYSDVTIPSWQSSQTASHQGVMLPSGLVFQSMVPDRLTTSETLLYTESQSGTLENQKPVALFEVDPPSGFTDTNFEFDATSSYDLETGSNLLQVRWDFDGDNHFDTEFSTSKIAFFKFTKPGLYQTILEVLDAGGLTGRMTAGIEVGLSSSAPIAHFTVTPENGRISDVFIFDAYGCYDNEDDNSLLKVRWDFDGDGIWDTNWSTRKIEYNFFRQEGRYVAKLEVQDTQGLTGSTSRIINVSTVNIKPEAFFTIDPETGTTETRFNFDASGSTDPEDSLASLRVRWDWDNDGFYDTDYRTIKTIQHVFPVAGVYTVVLEVIDTEGYGATYSLDVVVTNPNTPPDADFSIVPSPGKVNAWIGFDASLCVDLEDSPDKLEVRWDWNNDNIYDTEYNKEKVFSRKFSEAGTYIIRLQVKDSGGLTDTRVKLLVIE
jgi:hypothetical protein